MRLEQSNTFAAPVVLLVEDDRQTVDEQYGALGGCWGVFTGKPMRTEEEIRTWLCQLQQAGQELLSRLDALNDQRPTEAEVLGEYHDLAKRKLEVDRECNLLAWVLMEEQ